MGAVRTRCLGGAGVWYCVPQTGFALRFHRVSSVFAPFSSRIVRTFNIRYERMRFTTRWWAALRAIIFQSGCYQCTFNITRPTLIYAHVYIITYGHRTCRHHYRPRQLLGLRHVWEIDNSHEQLSGHRWQQKTSKQNKKQTKTSNNYEKKKKNPTHTHTKALVQTI